jgi:Uma2 family endonuclease
MARRPGKSVFPRSRVLFFVTFSRVVSSSDDGLGREDRSRHPGGSARIPEGDRRHELLDGALVEKGAASGEHGQAQFNLSTYLTPFRRRTGEGRPGGWWFATEVDVSFDPANVLRPDDVGFRRERVPERSRGVPIPLRPDWVCEVLSTNRRNDLIKKKRVYHRHEVPHDWVIDPEDERKPDPLEGDEPLPAPEGDEQDDA